MGYRIQNGEDLLQISWENKLWNESQEKDFITGLTGTFSDRDRNLADAAVQRVMLKSGANSHTIGMILDLDNAGRQGAGKNLVGFTEEMKTQKFRVFANDVRHGVDTEQYGLFAHRNEPYGILKQVNPLLGRWMAARRGKHARQAMVELVSDNIEEAPTSQTSGFNRHILIKNVAHGDQPAYDSTLATYTAAITTAMDAAGTTTAANVDIDFFTDLEYFITTQWKLMPFDDGYYVVSVPARQAIYLKRLASTESFAGIQKDAHINKYVEAAYGQFLMQVGKLMLIVDDRSPVIDYATNTGTLTPLYRDVGSTDARTAAVNGANNAVFDVGMVFGKAGLTETISMKPRFDDDITDFNRLRSVGISTTYGYQVTEFDQEGATATSKIGQNAGIWLAYSGAATT